MRRRHIAHPPAAPRRPLACGATGAGSWQRLPAAAGHAALKPRRPLGSPDSTGVEDPILLGRADAPCPGHGGRREVRGVSQQWQSAGRRLAWFCCVEGSRAAAAAAAAEGAAACDHLFTKEVARQRWRGLLACWQFFSLLSCERRRAASRHPQTSFAGAPLATSMRTFAATRVRVLPARSARD